MNPVVNLEEEPGRWVGRRRAADALQVRPEAVEEARKWRRYFPTPHLPKGVHRFHTHAEADAWLAEMSSRTGK